MSDFFSKMKSIFVVDSDKSAENNTPANEKKPSVQTEPSKEPNRPPAAGTAAAKGAYSDQFYKILFDAMEKNNQPGYDYLEFRKTLQALTSLNHDEKTRFLSAYAAAQASGVNADALVNSAGSYVAILNKEAENFNAAVEDQKSKQINNRQNEIRQLESLIQNKSDQMKKLEEEINEHRNMHQQLSGEISRSQEKIETTKANFNTTFQSLVNNIKGDIDRIKTFIQ